MKMPLRDLQGQYARWKPALMKVALSELHSFERLSATLSEQGTVL